MVGPFGHVVDLGERPRSARDLGVPDEPSDNQDHELVELLRQELDRLRRAIQAGDLAPPELGKAVSITAIAGAVERSAAGILAPRPRQARQQITLVLTNLAPDLQKRLLGTLTADVSQPHCRVLPDLDLGV